MIVIPSEDKVSSHFANMNRSSAVSASSSSLPSSVVHKRSYTQTGIITKNGKASRIFKDEKNTSLRLLFLKADGEIDSLTRSTSQSAPLSLRLRQRNDGTPSADPTASSDISSDDEDDGSLQLKTASAASSQSGTHPNAIVITTGSSNRSCSNDLLNVLTIDDGGDVEQRISRYRL